VAGGSTVLADPAASGYAVRADSVEAGAGSDVPVRFYLANEQAVTSLSVPISYDPSQATLKSISFTGSVGQHLANKIVTPANLSTANGHFMVAMFQWMEDPIPAGQGLLFTALFTVSPASIPGQFTLLDTLFYPPGGVLEVVRADAPGGIIPEFRPGRIMVREPNRPPVFMVLPEQYVLEGDSLKLTVRVTDPDGDRITLAVTSKPVGATFADNGDGTARFAWVPDFVGPNSADGSPVKVRFWAGDGDLSSQMELTINVVNRNRQPEITAPAEVAIEAGKRLEFSLSAFDPDFEAVTWSWSGLPVGATFDAANPGHLGWTSAVTDTGSYVMRFVARDPQGLADTALVTALVRKVALYTLSIDSVQAYPNEDFEFNIVLDNKLPVAGFNLLINHDPVALSYLSLSNAGTRSAAFEYFYVNRNHNGIPGNIRIIGIADMGGGTPVLAPGAGSIARGRLHTTGDLAFAGMSIPLTFRFLDTPVNSDNTLTDSVGGRIDQDQILYIPGAVLIHDIGQIRIGDINLNGLSAEIGDVIYFTNYFINPLLYKFNALQYANSDVNRDQIAATVSDLVALINWVVSGKPPAFKTGGDEELTATLSADAHSGVVTFAYDCQYEVGAALVVLETDQAISADLVTAGDGRMTLAFRQDGREVKVLLYSLVGEVLPSGRTELFTIAGLDSYEIAHVELGSAVGRTIEVSLAAAGSELPTGYELGQNYPNPFNPETIISFSLPRASTVELTVYNVLGQRVVTLVQGDYPAGTYQVTWNGTDAGGRPVSSGVYLYRLSAGSAGMTRKMMLLK
jgi:hypothetical protein